MPTSKDNLCANANLYLPNTGHNVRHTVGGNGNNSNKKQLTKQSDK